MTELIAALLLFVAALSLLVAVLSLLLNWYNISRVYGMNRRKIINAVYHHVNKAVCNLQEGEKGHSIVRERMKTDQFYTPYLVRSPDDDLTYDHIIEVMEWLDSREEEETVLSYFYSQELLHSLAGVFELEFVKGWPLRRKLEAWSVYEQTHAETTEFALAARRILSEVMDLGWRGRSLRCLRRLRKALTG